VMTGNGAICTQPWGLLYPGLMVRALAGLTHRLRSARSLCYRFASVCNPDALGRLGQRQVYPSGNPVCLSSAG
jgi:hypothetical protein